MYKIYKIFNIKTCYKFISFIRYIIINNKLFLNNEYFIKRLLKWINLKEVL